MASSSNFAPKKGPRQSRDENRKVEFRLSAKDSDAPPPCSPFPGKKTRMSGNKGLFVRCYCGVFCVLGVLRTTRTEWKALQSEAWVQHYQGSDKYLNTKFYCRADSLRKFISPLKVSRAQARLLLKEAELKVFGDMEVDDENKQEVEVFQELGQKGDNFEEVDQEMNVHGVEDEEGDVELGLQETGETNAQEVESETVKEKVSREKLWSDISICMERSDYELFVECAEVSEDVGKSRKFIARKKQFIKLYLEDKSPTELHEMYADIPPVVLESMEFKKRIGKVSMEEMSRRTVIENLSETVIELKKSPSKKNRDLVKIVAAAAASVR